MVLIRAIIFKLIFTMCSALDPTDGVIIIELENDNATAKTATLLLDQPFTILINNTSNDVRNISNIECHHIAVEYNVFTNTGNFKNSIEQPYIFIAQEGKAKKKMQEEWKCIIKYHKEDLDSQYYLRNSKPIVLYFQVTVRKPVYVKHIEVFVNDVIIPTTEVNAYEAKGAYKYSVGEFVKVSCKMSDAPLMNMSYFDGNSFVIEAESSSDENQTIYLKIESRHTHVTCNVLLNALNNLKQSIILVFEKRSHSNDLPTFNVNGLTLTPTIADNSDNSDDHIHYTLFYEYFEGEFIHFTVSNGKKWCKVGELENAEHDGDNVIYEAYAQNKTIVFKSHKSKRKTTTDITFNLRPVLNNFNATISGLPFSQTNMKYLLNRNTYRTEFFNKNNKVLNLNCSSSVYTNCKWDEDFTMNHSTDTSSKSYTFLPQDHTSEKTILNCTCEPYYSDGIVNSLIQNIRKETQYIHEVTILRDNKHARNSKEPLDYTKRGDKIKVHYRYPEENEDKRLSNNSDGQPTSTLVVIIVVALIIVAAVAWLMVGLYKRRQMREKVIQSEFNNTSLETISERTMRTPAQRENYSQPIDRLNENDNDTYSVPYLETNVEEMYTKPQPKSLRKLPNESLYAEPSYATVEQIGENPTYSNLSNQTAEYSEIQPKILIGNPNTPTVLSNESPYSEIQQSMRPNKESSKYVNVFDNQRYANSNNPEASQDRSEYAEPAYCEIGNTT